MEESGSEEGRIGFFIDERDSQSYRTVEMPDGKIWMAQNLNYKPKSGDCLVDYKAPLGIWAYDSDEANRGRYGLLYDWETAMAIAPAGWHLPSRAEWQALVDACGGKEVTGKKLKSKTGWGDDGNGTDEFGLSALPGGSRFYSDGSFDDAGYNGYWWSATEGGSGFAYSRIMYCNYDYLYEYNYYKEYGFAVRCVRD